MIFAYTRISRREQDPGRQLLILQEYSDRRKVPFDQIFVDQDQSDNFDRKQYKDMKRKLRSGDEVVVTELDRLGRNYTEVVKEYSELVNDGVRLTILDLPTMEGVTDTALRRMLNDWVIQLFSYVAEKEKEKIRSRVKDGLRKAKADGVKLGRPSLALPKKFDKLYGRHKDGELTVSEMATLLGKSRSQVYRYIDYYESERGSQEQLNVDGAWVPIVDGEHRLKKYK
jgi:DNA invertase Pin-like site-specific DNA recombinase